jgi:hypothetical protein
MKNNTAIVDTKNKVLTLMFQNEQHVVDLTEGDLHDNWNCITDKNDVLWDINFSWEDTKGEKPYLTVYALFEADENGHQSTDFDNSTSITVKSLGNRDDYFKDERFKYRFDSSLPLTFRVFDEKDNLILKTTRGNRASDESVYQLLQFNKKCYIVVMDSNGATKRIDPITK